MSFNSFPENRLFQKCRFGAFWRWRNGWDAAGNSPKSKNAFFFPFETQACEWSKLLHCFIANRTPLMSPLTVGCLSYQPLCTHTPKRKNITDDDGIESVRLVAPFEWNWGQHVLKRSTLRKRTGRLNSRQVFARLIFGEEYGFLRPASRNEWCRLTPAHCLRASSEIERAAWTLDETTLAMPLSTWPCLQTRLNALKATTSTDLLIPANNSTQFALVRGHDLTWPRFGRCCLT